MGASGTVYVALLVVALLASAAVGVLAWRRRSAREARVLLVLIGGGVVWLLSDLASVLLQPFWLSAVASKASYFGIVTVTPTYLVLTLLYTGREEWVSRRLVGLLAVEPVVVLAAVWFAPGSYRTLHPAPGALSGLVVVHGPLFWVHVGYAYVLTLLATGMLLELLYRSRFLYSKQVAAVLVGAVAPWVANVLYLSGAVPYDPTPVAFAITGVALSWAILEAGFIDLEPVARDKVVDNLNRGVYVFDANDRLVDVNPAGRRLLALREDPLGLDFDRLASGYPELAETFRDTYEHRETVVADTPQGVRAFDVEVTELTDYRDRTQGRVFLVQDVTERRRRERELERQNEQLDRFASVVSHDLRNPLNVLQGYVELARETGDTEPLDEAAASIDRMNRLIDDVLTLAREGRQIESTDTVDLREVAEDAWANVAVTDATLTVVDSVPLEADRSRLQQAFENLFRNSVEHAGPDVAIEVGPLPDEPGFYVQDDGPGIPDEHRADVFEYGYTTESEGTGLGLSIVDTISQAHGWTVTLADDDGGARFEFHGVDVGRTDSVPRVEGGG